MINNKHAFIKVYIYVQRTAHGGSAAPCHGVSFLLFLINYRQSGLITVHLLSIGVLRFEYWIAVKYLAEKGKSVDLFM